LPQKGLKYVYSFKRLRGQHNPLSRQHADRELWVEQACSKATKISKNYEVFEILFPGKFTIQNGSK